MGLQGVYSDLFLLLTCYLHFISGFDPGKPCELERYKAVFSGRFLPNCSPDGVFEPVQCYGQECWCVVKETGEEISNTRTKLPTIPKCDYPAIGASKIDLLKSVIKNKGDDIALIPDSFNGKPAYSFKSSGSVYALAKDYLTQDLWPDFSILVTARPRTLEGGFLFAIVDNLESIIQFGLSISKGDNEYTQHIELWYSENPTNMGSSKIARFTVPVMVGRWSRFAISVNGSNINLHAYCKLNYAKEEYTRSLEKLRYFADSFLLIGHGGEIFAEKFDGDIQELAITDDPLDAEKQCEPEEEVFEKQKPGLESEYGSGLDITNTYAIDPDSEQLINTPALTSLAMYHSNKMPSQQPPPGQKGNEVEVPDKDGDTGSGVEVEPLIGDPIEDSGNPLTTGLQKMTTNYLPTTALMQDRTTAVPLDVTFKGDNGEPTYFGPKGEKGEPGLQGMPGKHGINGIPGLDGGIGLTGMKGEKGEKGEVGIGEPGLPGIDGASVKGEPGQQGEKGSKGDRGESIVGPKGEPGQSFFAELEEMMGHDGSGELELEEAFSRVPGLQFLKGLKGEPGNCTYVEGMPGKDGANGIQGPEGVPGLPGQPGQRGERGPQGAKGDKGEMGMKGEQGMMGSRGEKGETGVRGLQGLQGPPGPPAVISDDHELITGLTGEPGLDGEPGTPGEKGEKGGPGAQGEKGSKGDPGTPGAEGPEGTNGIQGQPGLPGAPGAQGEPGRDGQKGDKGESGIGQPGLPGPPGPPGPGYGRPLFGGTTEEPDLSEMKGEKGEPGLDGKPGQVSYNDIANYLPMFTEKGDKGDKGERGPDGGCKMCVGFKGERGRRGSRGSPGKIGLKGLKGEIGAPGFPGIDGIPGAPGSPGDPVKGEKGEEGTCSCSQVSASPGIQGPNGKPGLDGQKGEKGERGEPGIIQSDDNVILLPGPPGPPGPPGQSIVGLQGPPGPRGFPGTTDKRPGSNLGNIVMFSNQDEMASSSLALPSGTLAFVIDSQRLYIRVNVGWQAISLGPVVPMVDGEFANSLPEFLEAPIHIGNMQDEAAAQGNSKLSGALKLFALNEPMTPSQIFGVSGADNLCYQQARAAKVRGIFRAVLTTRLQSIDSLVFYKDQDLSIVNSKGERLLNSWSGVTKGKGYWISDVPLYTFDGVDIKKDSRWKRKYFWHGADSQGEADTDSYCQAWTTSRSSELGVASSLLEGQLLDKSLHTCDSPLAVLCIESTLQH